MGQSIFGMIIISVAFLAVFGGYQNQTLYSEFLPPGVTGPNDVNNYQNSIVVSSQGTPFGTVTSQNPTQDNNPIFNFVSKDIPNLLNAFATTASASIDLWFHIGLPAEIIYIFAVLIGSIMTVFAVYFAGTIALGFFGRFGQ